MPTAAAAGRGPASDRRGTFAARAGTDMDGAALRGGADAPLGPPDPAGRTAGAQGGARQTMGGPPHAETQFAAPRRAVRPVAVAAARGVYARPEPDGEMVGSYMRDAIGRGGYRAALEYYSSAECERTDAPRCRLRTKGWLLGRLGLYDRVKNWLEEASAWDDLGHLLASADSLQHAAYRAPAPWLETPQPAPRNSNHIMTLEPVAAPCRDLGKVPGAVWSVMLILDAAGPICSHAGLGAAAHLVEAGAVRRAAGSAGGDRRYDPRRGAKLHGAPAGCHRWIIADIDFVPRPPNKPHYYYDLTDEGRRALAGIRKAGAPWQRATEDAAAGLGGMSLPDLLENACRFGGPARGLDKLRGDLGRLVDAWRAQDDGMPAPPVSAEDQALADLGLAAKWPETGGGAGSAPDHLLYLMTIIDSTRAVACEAEPSTGAEGAVLRTLIAAIQDLCRRHGGAVAAAASSPSLPHSLDRNSSAGCGSGTLRLQPHADETPALISDLYYCLAEYCRSRRLAADPCSRPFSERFTDDEKAVVARALMEDSPYSGVD